MENKTAMELEIESFINSKLLEPERSNYLALYNALQEIIVDVSNHLKEVSSQLSNYDAHDKDHSYKVLENITCLLRDTGISKLSCYELILIYAASFLHDAAMALPGWEYNLLKSVEGTAQCHDPKNVIGIRNDLKPVQPKSELLDIINSNNKELYGDFAEACKFVFSHENEAKFCLDLAERVHDYENFRSGYSDKLNRHISKTKEFLNYSDLVRSEFIRMTHHTRIETYVCNLKKKFSDALRSQALGEQVAQNLSRLCRSHGESFEFVKELNHEEKFKDESANMQFLAMLLRLGDVIHFSSDRASLSWFAEKRITDSESIKHWKAKFQDLTYKIDHQDDKAVIRFSAYCHEPDIYYFIQDYMDNYIDRELDNFHALIRSYKNTYPQYLDRYNISVEPEVDRTDILPNKDIFTPEANLKFSLDQKKILSLLTGVQLYTDKYLCLRELYQNSLDACKSMKEQNALSGMSQKYHIKFGLGEYCNTDGVKQKYIYCLDNGTGMTKEIVREYFLKIGNSYYKSKDFIRQNTNWQNTVNPISQFGIGALSCYMLADRLEVTTKHYSDNAELFSFSLDGPNENFYYINTNSIESDMLGTHGTLIKLFLKEGFASSITCGEMPKNRHFSIFKRRMNHECENSDAIDKDLFFIINKQIGLPADDVEVTVKTKNDVELQLIRWDEMIDYEKCKEVLDENIITVGFTPLYLPEVINYKANVADIPIMVKNENIEIYSIITLPKNDNPKALFHEHPSNIDPWIWQRYARYRIINEKICHLSHPNVLVNGIVTSIQNLGPADSILMDNFSDHFSDHCKFNFNGPLQPILSISRNEIISFPVKLEESLLEIKNKFMQELVFKVSQHIKDYKIRSDSKAIQFIMDIVAKQSPMQNLEFIIQFSKVIKGGIQLANLEIVQKGVQQIDQLIKKDKIDIKNLDWEKLTWPIMWILVGKLLEAASILVVDSNICITSKKFNNLSVFFDYSRENFSGRFYAHELRYHIVICSDQWSGEFEQFDMATHLWPIIPKALYEILLKCVTAKGIFGQPFRSLTERALLLPETNIIIEMAQRSPELIFSVGESMGKLRSIISTPNYSTSVMSRFNEAFVYLDDVYTAKNPGEKKSYLFYAFIAPEILTAEQKIEVQDCVKHNPEHVHGIRKGWSILFSAGLEYYSTKLPGVVPRETVLERLLANTNIGNSERSYYFTDGTLAVPGTPNSKSDG